MTCFNCGSIQTSLREDQMALVGVFMNLKCSDPAAVSRQQALERELPGYSFDYSYGEGAYDKYEQMAADLVNRNTDARIFVASCWPTMKALYKNTPVGIVF